jgi:hypothetical protein
MQAAGLSRTSSIKVLAELGHMPDPEDEQMSEEGRFCLAGKHMIMVLRKQGCKPWGQIRFRKLAEKKPNAVKERRWIYRSVDPAWRKQNQSMRTESL